MGNCGSGSQRKAIKDGDEEHFYKTNDILFFQESLRRRLDIPLEVQVAHFTPSSFPLLPTVSKKNSKICEDSWRRIVDNSTTDEYGVVTSGITSFYNEFYERLGALDSSGKFEAVLSRHSSGQNQIAAKGAILVRIIKFVLKIESDSKETQLLLYMLGKSHSQKHIRPWQYATFIQTLLLTIASRLGVHATNDVMEAWVNLFAFIMKSMLPPAIKGQVVETELNINTSSEFADGKVAQEVAAMEDARDVRKRLGGKHSGSKHSGESDTASEHHPASYYENGSNGGATPSVTASTGWAAANKSGDDRIHPARV